MYCKTDYKSVTIVEKAWTAMLDFLKKIQRQVMFSGSTMKQSICIYYSVQVNNGRWYVVLKRVWEGGLFVGCLTSQQHASVSKGRICTDNFACCHTEIEVTDQTFYLTQSQYTDTGLTSPSADPTMPGAWQGSHWSANF